MNSEARYISPDAGQRQGVIMGKGSSTDVARKFLEQVWRSPPSFEDFDDLVVEDFVFISAGRRIEGREEFKKWATGFIAAIGNMELEVVESFENRDGSRVAATWRVTGMNNGAFGTKPDGSPIEMTGSSIMTVRDDGMLVSIRVERSAFEVYKQLTASNSS